MILATMVSMESLFFVSLLSLLINIFLVFAVFAIAVSLSKTVKSLSELKEKIGKMNNVENDEKEEKDEEEKKIDKNAPIEQQVKQMLEEDIPTKEENAKNEYDEYMVKDKEIAEMLSVSTWEEIPSEVELTPPNKKQYALPPAKTIYLEPIKNELELLIQRAFIEIVSPVEEVTLKPEKVLTVSVNHKGNNQRRESDSLPPVIAIEAKALPLPIDTENKTQGMFSQEELKSKNMNQLKKLAKELGINIYHFNGRGKHMKKQQIIDSILKR